MWYSMFAQDFRILNLYFYVLSLDLEDQRQYLAFSVYKCYGRIERGRLPPVCSPNFMSHSSTIYLSSYPAAMIQDFHVAIVKVLSGLA